MEKITKKDMNLKRVRKVKGPIMVPTHTNEATSDPHLFRVVDMDGEWTHYFDDQANVYLPAVNWVISNGWPKGAGLIEYFKRTPKEELEKSLRTAGGKGAKVHAAIRDIIDGKTIKIEDRYKDENNEQKPLTYTEWQCLMAWQKWAAAFSPTILTHETAVKNLDQKYAGTIDFRGGITIPKGAEVYVDDKLKKFDEEVTIPDVLLDWKSGSGIYDEAKLQIAAYAYSSPDNLPTLTGVVRIGTKHKTGWEMRLYTQAQTAYHYEQFQNAYSIFRMIMGDMKKKEPRITEIPLSISVIVPQAKVEKKKEKKNADKRKPDRKGVRKPDKKPKAKVRVAKPHLDSGNGEAGGGAPAEALPAQEN